MSFSLRKCVLEVQNSRFFFGSRSMLFSHSKKCYNEPFLKTLQNAFWEACWQTTTSDSLFGLKGRAWQSLTAQRLASGPVRELDTAHVAAVPVRVRRVRAGAWRGRHAPWYASPSTSLQVSFTHHHPTFSAKISCGQGYGIRPHGSGRIGGLGLPGRALLAPGATCPKSSCLVW